MAGVRDAADWDRYCAMIDPELLPLLDIFTDLELTDESLAEFRQSMDEGPPDPPPPANVRRDAHRCRGLNGAPDVPVLVYTPTDVPAPLPAYLHIHGGGYIGGSAENSDAANRELASRLGCVVAAVDYRLAPETRHPGPVEDCYAALLWLQAEAARLGVDAARIAIGGESAGGGLTAALALLARDRGQVPIIGQMLIYPMLDDRTCTRTDLNPYVGRVVWTPQANRFGWQSLLGTAPGGSGISPYAAAARAADLTGLPETFIATATLDLFLEENMDYAARLMRAGIRTALHVYPSAFHGFDCMANAAVSRGFRRDFDTALAGMLGTVG